MDKPVTRKRINPTSPTPNNSPATTSPVAPSKPSHQIPGYVHAILILGAVFCVLFFTRHAWIPKLTPERSFTRAELAKYDGSDPDLPIYMGVKGKVFDVTAGKRHYGKNGVYGFFAGRDATRSLYTGCFDPNDIKCTENSHKYDDANEKQLNEIQTWVDFYTNHKEYNYVGYISDV